MSEFQVQRSHTLEGEIEVSGDKSISHRAIMMAGLASGTSRITGFLNSEDCLATLSAMEAMGVETERISPTSLIIHGRKGRLKAPLEPLDCGNSGTTIRLLSGVIAGQPFSARLFGDASLSRRPMKRIADPLNQMGARVECTGDRHTPPLQVHGGPLRGIDYTTPVPSAQIKSAILLAGLSAEGRTSVTEKKQSRDHTERMLRYFQGSVHREGLCVSLHGPQILQGRDFHVPGDFSSAAFWLVAAAAMPKSKLTIRQVGLNPTRTGALNVLMRMGAQIIEQVDDPSDEPSGTLIIQQGGQLRGTTIEGDEIPNVIDEIPILAVAGALAQGETQIRGAEELRVKESDRISTMTRNLRAFGVPVEELPDGMIIQGGASLSGARVDSEGDHRIAMAFAILGLFASGTTTIVNTECVATSYPLFFDHFHKLTQTKNLITRLRSPKS